MVISKLDKKKKNYLAIIDENEYSFSEDIVLKYKLLPNREIDDETLKKALSENKSLELYDKAVSYQIKYAKGEAEVRRYLFDKGLTLNDVSKIIDLMKERKILDDDKLLDGLINSLIKKSNGKALIKEKLYQKGYKKEDIERHLKDIDYDLYFAQLNKLYGKIKDRYDKYEPFIRIQKIKAYLFSRGYSSSEISSLDLN